ncbi:MAG TPA: hypothetical protein VF145_05870 [Chitinophagaceae bacterium]
MKNTLILLACAVLVLSACKKEKTPAPAVNYSGTYKGEVKMFENGVLSSTTADYSMQFTHDPETRVAIITNNVFAANTGSIEGITFTLVKKVIASSPTYNTEQTGTAAFTATNVTINFREQQVDLSNGAVLNTKTWTGTLTKQ